MSGKINQDRQKPQRKPERMLLYLLFLLSLAVLIGAAFVSPKWVFGIQDGIQCEKLVLEEKENVDVTALSTNYEASFYQRMADFAENPPDSTKYYVASEELTNHQELQRFLQSESGLYRDSILFLTEVGLVTQDIFTSNITRWKQYVIYSDDYARGVNFILWYIELESSNEDTGTYRLLLEAETGEVYGVRADTGDRWLNGYDGMPGKTTVSLEEFLGVIYYTDYYSLWETAAYFFSGLEETNYYSDYKQYLEQVSFYEEKAFLEKVDKEALGLVEDIEQNNAGTEMESNLWSGDSMVEYWTEHPPRFVSRNNGNRLECTFPYGRGDLIFGMKIPENLSYPWIIHDVTVGFPAIYEMIPEFG